MVLMEIDVSRASVVLGVGTWGKACGLTAAAPHRPRLQRACAGSCPSCFSEVQASWWCLWWCPLKANLRSGVGIKIYIGLPAPDLPADGVFFPLLLRHMKIHEKDPNSTASTTPPSPLKRRRLSSKRKFSHDAELDREDRTPAKKVLYGAWSKRYSWLPPKLSGVGFVQSAQTYCSSVYELSCLSCCSQHNCLGLNIIF